MPKERPFTVFIQNWTGRGPGKRPDGFTIHLSLEHHRLYVEDYNRQFSTLQIPSDMYVKVDDPPIEIEVDSELYGRIQRASSNVSCDSPSQAAHLRGAGDYFSTSPMRQLRDGDIRWPTVLRAAPTAGEVAIIHRIAAWVETLREAHYQGGQRTHLVPTRDEIVKGIRNRDWDK